MVWWHRFQCERAKTKGGCRVCSSRYVHSKLPWPWLPTVPLSTSQDILGSGIHPGAQPQDGAARGAFKHPRTKATHAMKQSRHFRPPRDQHDGHGICPHAIFPLEDQPYPCFSLALRPPNYPLRHLWSPSAVSFHPDFEMRGINDGLICRPIHIQFPTKKLKILRLLLYNL